MKRQTLSVIVAIVVVSLSIAAVVYASNQLSEKKNSIRNESSKNGFSVAPIQLQPEETQSKLPTVDLRPSVHESTEEVILEPAIQPQPEKTPDETSAVAVTETTAESEELLDVPVYSEDYLLFDTNGTFYLGRDAANYYYFSAMQNSTEGIMRRYPTDAIRLKDNGSKYTIHETDSGYRLYLFYDQSRDYTVTIGFPVVVREMLSFSDFAELQIGDRIETVEAIDPVAGLHKKMFIEVWKLNVKAANYYSEQGQPCTSIHYLSDGLLKIKYDMPEEGVLVVSKILFAEDYVLTDLLGRKVDYSIDRIDLPNR